MSLRGTEHERIEEERGFKYIRLKSGRLLSFWDAHHDAERARASLGRAMSRMFKLEGEYDSDWVERAVDDLESYVTVLRREIDRRKNVKSIEGKIAQLRNVTGRTPEEAALYRRKADEMERRLREDA